MLYLCMPEGQGQWLWQLDDQGWQLADSLDQLIQTVKAIYQGQQAIVFFPSQMAQFYTQQLTRPQYKQLGQSGIQYLIEEQCIEPIDHLAIFHDFHADQLNFIAVTQKIREIYQQSLTLLPWHIQSLLPDFLIIPEPAPHSINIMQIFDRQIIRWAKFRGWIIEDAILLEKLKIEIKQINFYDVSDRLYQNVTEILAQDVEYRHCESEKLHISNFKQHPFNILLKSKRKNVVSNQYWKACAAILCLVVLIQTIYDGLRWWKYKTIADQTVVLAIDQYKQWFPNENRINEQNLKTNFKAKLQSNAVADRQALQLISRVGPILQQASIRAEQLNYQNNALTLSVFAKNSDALSKLAEQFKQQGFSVELGTIRNQGTDVVGLIKVQ